MLKKVFRFFSKPRVLASLNILLIVILIVGNIYWPVACQPSPWATVVLLICFISTVSYPWVKNEKLSMLLGFFNGVSLFVYAYFIVFLSFMNLYGFVAMVVGLGFLTYIPHLLLGQLIRNYLWKPKSKGCRKLFLTGLVSALLLMMYSGISYHVAATKLEIAKEQGFSHVSQDFMTEKIVGMHFIYHTRYCPWDGWRPPKHEPLLVMGLWLNGYSPWGTTRNGDPLHRLNLIERIDIYQEVYPNNPIKFNCACSLEDRWAYHNDALWCE